MPEKQLIAAMLAVSLLCGCGTASSRETNTDAANYETYYRTVSSNEDWMDGSYYFTLSGEMAQVEDGSYRYYVFLDDARIAMYDIAMIAVENDTAYDANAKMMPNIGIMGSGAYTMIPNQYNPDRGFVKGLVISGETQDDSITLKVLVEWRDKDLENVERAFIGFTLTTDGWVSSSTPQEVQIQSNE